MAHPHLLARPHLPNAVEERAGLDDIQVRPAELALSGGRDGATQGSAHGLLAVADAEKRDAQRIEALVGARRLGFGERRRAAREDDAARRQALDFGRRRPIGSDLAEDPGLAHAPRDQLGHLRAEVEDQDVLGHVSPP